MISIVRKSKIILSSRLFSNPNSFLCSNSNVHFILSIQFHFFSTSRVKKRLIYSIPSPEICDVLVNKHKFSPESASLASSRLPKFRSPERADSVLSFLKEYSFTTTQMEKIVAFCPRILGFTIESLKFRFNVFQDIGLFSEDIAKVMSTNSSIIYTNLEKRIVPKLSILKSLLGSNQEVARHLRRSARFLTADLERTLLPNVEILKSCGIPMELILSFLWERPRCFVIKPDIMRKSVDRAIKMGVPQTSTLFIHAANVLASTSEGMWEVRLRTLRDLGFSDDDTFAMFRKQPMVFSFSVKKMKHVIEVLLATGKYNISDIVACPRSLGCSIVKRLQPRLQILGVLETKNLIAKWPALSTIATFTDGDFFDRFVGPYYDEIGEQDLTKVLFIRRFDA